MVGSCSYQRGPAKTSSKSASPLQKTQQAFAGFEGVRSKTAAWRVTHPIPSVSCHGRKIRAMLQDPSAEAGDSDPAVLHGWPRAPNLRHTCGSISCFSVIDLRSLQHPTACSNLEWIGTDCHPDFKILGHIRTSVDAVRQDTEEHSHPFPFRCGKAPPSEALHPVIWARLQAAMLSFLSVTWDELISMQPRPAALVYHRLSGSFSTWGKKHKISPVKSWSLFHFGQCGLVLRWDFCNSSFWQEHVKKFGSIAESKISKDCLD